MNPFAIILEWSIAAVYFILSMCPCALGKSTNGKRETVEGMSFRKSSIATKVMATSPSVDEGDESTEQWVGTGRGLSATPSGDAVVIRKAQKSYGAGQKVLNGLDMTVPCGSIYGLLGSSGSGKTTLLSCIVGLRTLDRGQLWIFGEPPGSRSIGIPGKNVGYMPQELSLYKEFSIEETLNYFGRLNGMEKDEIKGVASFMLGLLSLPKGSSRVGSLSGGQQRRVSLIVALLSKPELLVLDEPTVGVDPLIRQSIWLHLRELVRKQRTTVIITTHYIEECRGADNVGILRNGRLLEEGPTERLMHEHGTTNLEKIILDLSRRARALRRSSSVTTNNWVPPEVVPSNMAKVLHESVVGPKDSFNRICAIAGKNLVILFRNPLLVFAIAISAAFVEALGCSQGGVPKGLTIGIVNEETLSCGNITGFDGNCSMEMLSCRVLSCLDKDIMNLEPFTSETAAMAAVRDGNSWGYIMFPSNFSEALFHRVSAEPSQLESDNWAINSSQYIVQLDEINKVISTTIKTSLLMAFEEFAKGLFRDCGYDERAVEYPFQFREPIVGNEGTNIKEFQVPGTSIIMLYFFPIAATAIRHIREKKNGVFDRSLVSGVKTWEVLVAYAISEFCLIQVQTLLTYLVITQLFGMRILGSGLLLYSLFMLSGYAGVSIGFLLGLVCTEELQATVVTMGAFLPNLVLSAVLSPEESMFPPLRHVVQFLPGTIPGEAARSITSRAWEFSHYHVWPGFAVLAAYIVGCFILTLVFSGRRKS